MIYMSWSAFADFHCAGASCPQNCCEYSWNIDVDEPTVKLWQDMEGEIGERLRAMLELRDNGRYYIKTNGDKHCPMLTDKGLCELYSKCGADAQCKTCREYPRGKHKTNAAHMSFMSLGCPETARMLLSCKEKSNITYGFGASVQDLYNVLDDHSKLLLTVFSDTIQILQNRDIDIASRLRVSVLFYYMLDAHTDDKRELSEILSTFEDEDNVKNIASSLNATAGWNADKLVGAITSVLSVFLRGGNPPTLAAICDEISLYIRQLSDEGDPIDIQEIYKLVKKSNYELQFEQYLTYSVYLHYFNSSWQDASFGTCIRRIVRLYLLLSLFMAILTHKKGKALTLDERVKVLYELARHYDHDETAMRDLCEVFDLNCGTEVEKVIGVIV